VAACKTCTRNLRAPIKIHHDTRGRACSAPKHTHTCEHAEKSTHSPVKYSRHRESTQRRIRSVSKMPFENQYHFIKYARSQNIFRKRTAMPANYTEWLHTLRARSPTTKNARSNSFTSHTTPWAPCEFVCPPYTFPWAHTRPLRPNPTTDSPKNFQPKSKNFTFTNMQPPPATSSHPKHLQNRNQNGATRKPKLQSRKNSPLNKVSLKCHLINFLRSQ